MKEIDKSLRYSTEYFSWLENKKDTAIPYNSSSNKFYNDVLMNLLACQDGLCAYTEKRLCEPHRYSKGRWGEGRYEGETGKLSVQIDHFDSSTKKKNGWEWNNLFAVFGPANNQKSDKASLGFMRPDNLSYSPEKYLTYNKDQHRFLPRDEFVEDERMWDNIQYMIDTLGLNLEGIVDLRRKDLRKAIQAIKDGMPVDLDQFPTAFAMIKDQLGLS